MNRLVVKIIKFRGKWKDWKSVYFIGMEMRKIIRFYIWISKGYEKGLIICLKKKREKIILSMIIERQLNGANDVIALFDRFGIYKTLRIILFLFECDPRYVRNGRY